MANKTKERQRPANRKTQKLVKNLVTLAVVVAVAVGLYFLVDQLAAGRPGYSVPDKGRGHTPTCSPQYNSRPPTSGCHNPGIAPYQVFDQPIDNNETLTSAGSLQVHNLEHGAVIIHYRPSGIPSEDDGLKQELADLVGSVKNKDKKYCRLMLAPYPVGFAVPPDVKDLYEVASTKKIALTAWNRIDLLDSFDEKRITDFIDAFINHGPENVNDCAS